jgi:preprotein translocase, secE subunit
MSKIIGFGKECFAELRKVVWPTKDDVISAVKVVVVSTILVAFFLGVVDAFFVACLGWIF